MNTTVDLPTRRMPRLPLVLGAWLFAVLLTMLTVSLAHPGGEKAYVLRLVHFVLQGSALWVAAGIPATHDATGWPARIKTLIIGVGLLMGAGALWAGTPY